VTYQDVVNASIPYIAWALVEASGTDFAPYAGVDHLTGAGINLYQQSGPFAASLSVHGNPGKLYNATNLPFNKWWFQEAWFNPDASTRAVNALLCYLGLATTNGWGAYLPTANNHIHVFFASPSQDVDTGITLPANAWSLVQVGNLSGTTGEVDVAVNGVVVAQVNAANAKVAPTNGYGFGGDSVQTSGYTGRIAFPAVYLAQQTVRSLYSRFLAATDPDAAIGLGTVGPSVAPSVSADVASLLAYVAATYQNTP
jgi:hypothetical protein